MSRATVGAFRELARDRLLVAIDDEQWVDTDSSRVLAAAVAWLRDDAVGWLIARRSDEAQPDALLEALDRQLGPDFHVLSLRGLPETQLTSLVMNRFPGEWSPGLLKKIVELADGNPYLALELARETSSAGGHTASSARLPVGLAQTLRTRVQRLSPTASEVVQVAALAAGPSRQLLRSVIGREAEVDSAIDEAVESDVLADDPTLGKLRFTHPLLREVVAGSLSMPVRHSWHRRLADAVTDQDVAAAHLAAAAQEPDDGVAATVAAAAARALANAAPAHAATLAEASVTLSTDPSGADAWRRRLLVLDCLEAASEFARARALAESWWREAPPGVAAEIGARRGRLANNFDEGARIMSEALNALSEDPHRQAQVATDLAVVVGIHLLRLQDGAALARRAVGHAQDAKDPILLRGALAVDGFLAALLGVPGAGSGLRSATEIPGLSETAFPYYSPETRLAMWHMWRGEVDMARGLYREVLAAGERRGSAESVHGTRLHLVEVELRAGNWAEAEHHAIAVDRYMRTSGATQAGLGEYGMSQVLAARGATDRARDIARDGAMAAEAQNTLVFAMQCRSVLGQLELSVDDPAAAVAWLEPIARLFHAVGFGEPGLFGFPADLTEAYARLGRTDDAVALLHWIETGAERLDHPWARITGARAAAAVRLAAGEPALAASVLHAAIAEAAALGLPLERGRCMLALGIAQRRCRQRRAAARTLADAAAIFTQLGAAQWAARAREQIERVGSVPSGTLTPTEHRVAELAAGGRSNSEIAADMMMSVKTVESNLTRVYRKLGVRGRVDLGRSTAL